MDWKKWKSLKENIQIEEEKIDVRGMSFDDLIAKLDSLRDSTFIFFDTETTGFKPEFEQITQIAGVAIDFEDGEAVEQSNINLYAHLTPEIEQRLEKDMEEGSEYRQWLDRQKDTIIKIDKNDSLTQAQKEARIQLAKDPKFVLRMTGYLKQQGYSFSSDTDLENFINSPEVDSEEFKAFAQEYSFGDDEQKFSLHGTATDSDKTEEDMLQEFYDFVLDNDNVILLAHNSDFDMDMVNTRNSLYGIPQLKEGSNINGVLDTLDIASSYKDALEALLSGYKKELSSIDIDQISQAFQQSQVEMPKPEALQEEEYKSSWLAKSKTHDTPDPVKPDSDVSKLSSDIMKKINELPDEMRSNALRVYALNTLIRSVENTLGILGGARNRFSRRLGDLASNMKVSPEGWHDALADVRMLINVYNNMYRTITMARDYNSSGVESILSLKESFSLISEMEPYQQKMHNKHPKWKSKLTRGGKVRDNSTPYKIKISLKRGKSAPPGAGG